MKHVLAYLTGCPWAITERMMDTMLQVIEREQDLDAVAARLGRPLENTGGRVERRDGVAIIEVNGPVFRYANLFTEISGGTSIEKFSTDFTAAIEDASIDAILLNVDSPGGEVNGVSEMAERIHAGRAVKPVWAYVGGMAASGAYWIASAASRIVMHRSAMSGSIGVIASIVDDRAKQERYGTRKHEIISSQSPHKRADPTTDEGKAKLQGLVDDTAALFIAQVAEYRSTTPEHVMAQYGQGFVLMGPKALEAGMVDELGTYEGTLAKLNQRSGAGAVSLAAGGTFEAVMGEEGSMAESATQPQQQQQAQLNEVEIRAAAVEAERIRIQSILNCENSKGREKLAQKMALETTLSAEVCQQLLGAAALEAAGQPAQQTDQFAEYMRKAGNPKVGVEREETDDVAAEVNRIVAYLPQNQRRRAS